MGNSEVGHLNIGGGRIVGQDLPRITQAISDGTFFKNQIFTQACDHAKKNNSALHIMGMASNGNVHSSDEHLYALIAFAKECGLKDVYIHMFTDGRDTAEKAALDTLRKLKQKIAAIGVGKVASVTGRFYAMDRGKHWEQTLMTYEALVFGKGPKYSSAEDCILDNYNNGVYDEMIQPSVITKDDGSDPVAVVKDGDAVVFFNFRSDRALQLTEAFVKPELVEVKDRYEPLKNLYQLVAQMKRGGKIIALLGACGERDRGKRPMMGEIVSSYADTLILTNEDPYYEDPDQILDDIEKGLPESLRESSREGIVKTASKEYLRIFDRREAIAKALAIARSGDIVVITGKGAEETMKVGAQSIPWNDARVVREELEKK
jgi:hypothetical protein